MVKRLPIFKKCDIHHIFFPSIVIEYKYIVKKITTAGVVSDYAGMSDGTGRYKDGICDNNRYRGGSLYGPEQIAIDVFGNIVVADSNSQVIRKIEVIK